MGMSKKKIIKRTPLVHETAPVAATPDISNLETLDIEDQASPVRLGELDNVVFPAEEEEDRFDIDSEDRLDANSCWPYAEDVTSYQLEAEVRFALFLPGKIVK